MSAAFVLLMIDDDDFIFETMKWILPSNWQLERSKFEIPPGRYDAAFIDLHLTNNFNNTEGITLIRELRNKDPHLDIVAISGDLDRTLMEQSLVAGATRFLGKPLSQEEIAATLEKIEAFLLLKEAHRSEDKKRGIKWIGNSKNSIKVQKTIATLKSESGPILIQGETGTGKELAANLLHFQEERGSLIAVNVATIPEHLFESEVFGHMKGSFTGAEQNRMGLAEAAHGGDLFLDEIEALPLNLQAKLLRFLESGEIRRIGGKENIKIQTRIIAATNKNLNELVQKGEFREDLLWRLCSKVIHLPPLRERKEDIKELSENFINSQRPRQNKTLSEDALNCMISYHWPGNVRELKRVCEQLCLNSPLPVIRKEDILNIIASERSSEKKLWDLSKGLSQILFETEEEVLKQSLKVSQEADKLAQILKISRSTLYKKISDHALSLSRMPHE